MICVVFFTDGRKTCMQRTVASFDEMASGHITRRVIHDDSSDPSYRFWLEAAYPDYEVIGGPHRRGFAGAIGSAWRWASENVAEPYIAHWEDDFTLRRSVDLDAMTAVLQAHPHIAQMALRRQPWNEAEARAGGVVECDPDSYTERAWNGHVWLEHRNFWTTNPSVFGISRCMQGWPQCEHSEGIHSARVFADPDVVCGYWGSRDSGEAVTHIGLERVGHTY